MQRVKLSLACLLCLSMVGSAAAQTVVDSDPGVAALQDYSGGVSYGGAYFDVRTMTGDGVGYRQGYTQLGVTVPIWVTEDMYLAPMARLLVTDASNVGTNAGLLARRYNANFDRVFGAYGFYDFDHSVEGFDYNQVSFGFDTLGDRWDARANVYLPTTDDTNFVRPISVGTAPIFFGNSLGFIGTGLFQGSVAGADFEFGIPLSKSTPWLRGFAGAYFYESNGAEDLIGPRARVEAWVSDDLSVGVNVTDDDASGTNVNAVVDFRFSGWRPTRYFPQWTSRERMTMPVQRNWRVSAPNYLDDVTVAGKNPTTGQPYFIVHVDHTNAGTGDGSAENPFSNLPSSAPGADIILVQADGTSILNPIRGSIALEDGQRLLGEGKAYSADVQVGFADLPMFTQTVTLPGIEADGNYPFLTSVGNIVTLADDNQVAGFNMVNAGGFAITNSPLPNASNNFDLRCLNITGNNGGIFLTNATGTGVIEDVHALNNALGGISIESGITPLNLTVNDVTSNSLPAGTQAFGMELTAGPGTINATITNVEFNRNGDGLRLIGNAGDLNVSVTDASISDNTDDGVFISGNNSNIDLTLRDATVNRNNGEGLQATMSGGSLTILGRNVTINNNTSDNVNLGLVNADMDIDFADALFNSSDTGSGFVLANSGGTGTLLLTNVGASGNDLDGLNFSGDNFADIDATIRTSVFNNNGRDAISVSAANGADVGLDIAAVSATGSARHGLNFNATGGSVLNINSLLSTFNNSGTVDPTGNGVNGFVDGSIADVTLIGTPAANAGNHGMFVVAQNSADVSISVNQGNFQNSGQLNPGVSDAVNIITDSGANLVLQINNTPMNNVNGNVTQDDGFVIDSSNSSTALVNISNSDLSDNLGNAIQATVDSSAAVTINLLDITAQRSGQDGILFNVQTTGALTINSMTLNTLSNSFDDSGASGMGDGIDGFIRTDGDVTFNFTNTTFRRSAENGFLLDISDLGSTFTGTFTNGDFSDSGEAMLGVGQQDAFNITAANDASATITLVNTPSFNTQTPPAGTQQRGLFADVSSGADLVFFNQDGNMSNNLLNALNVNVTGVGSTADVTLLGTVTGAPLLASNSGEDGFIFVVTDSGDLDAVFQNSSLDSSGLLGVLDPMMMGIGSDFDAIDGTIDTSGNVTLSFMDTLVTNAFNDAMEIDATNSGVLNATFDNSPLDNAGTNNFGDALRLTFASGAVGTVTLQNNTTAINAGDDAVFTSATGTGTSITVNSLISDFSDSGTTADVFTMIDPNTGNQRSGGNGIQSLVADNAQTFLNIQDTLITNTNPTLPQLRGLSFDVQSGGNLQALFSNSVLSDHFLHGISGQVQGSGTNDSRAVITLDGSPVDGNGLFGAVFNVDSEGDLLFDVSGAAGFNTISNNGAAGVAASVDGMDSTATFVFNGTQINGNGNIVGGDGVTITADNGASVFGAMNGASISNNANGGLVLTVDNGSTADFGVTTTFLNPTTGMNFQTGLVDTVIDNNGNEGILAFVDNGSELDFNMVFGTVGSSVSNNGTLGTAGDPANAFDNVNVSAMNGSDVEVQFVQTIADNSTRSGFNFTALDSMFLAQLRAGVSAQNNTGGNGVRFVASGATTQAVLFMDETTADGPLTTAGALTGTNNFSGNGSDVITVAGGPDSDAPLTGAGVFFQATNVDTAAVRLSGMADNNGNIADLLANRDIDGDGDGDHDGFYVNFNGVTNMAAFELVATSSANGNVDEGLDFNVTNVAMLTQVTKASELTPPSVTVGQAGNGISITDIDIDGNGGDGIQIVVTGPTTMGDILVDNVSSSNNGGNGLIIDLTNVTGVMNDLDLTITNSIFDSNGGNGVAVLADTSPFDTVLVDSNLISNSMGGDGFLFQLTNSAVATSATFSNNGISGSRDNGLNIDLTGSPITTLNIVNNAVGGAGALLGLDFQIPDATNAAPLQITNTSAGGIDIVNFLLDLGPTTTVTPPGSIWDTIEPGASSPFVPFGGTDVTTGLSSINGTAVVAPIMQVGFTTDTMDSVGTILPGGGVPDDQPILDLGFNDFNPGETFIWTIDSDFIGQPASIPSGADLIGSNVTVNFTGGLFIAGTLQPIVGNPNGSQFVATSGNIGFGGINQNGLDGIRVSQAAGSDIGALNVNQNVVQANGQHGVELLVSNSLLGPTDISGNTITDNGGDGVRLVSPTTVANDTLDINMDDNTISTNGGTGVNINLVAGLQALNFNTAEGNTVADNTGGAGFDINLADNLGANAFVGDFGLLGDPTQGNTITGNAGPGVNINVNNDVMMAGTQSSITSNFTGNTIDNNGTPLGGQGVNLVVGNGGNITGNFDTNSVSGNANEGVNYQSGLGSVITADYTNNTINGNGSHGINIPLQDGGMFVSNNFYGNTIGTTAARNGGFGVRLIVPNNAMFNWALGDSTQAQNLITGNTDAGVGIDMTGNATGTFGMANQIVNTVFNNTIDGADANFNGDGLAIRLSDSSALTGVTIGDGTLMNTGASGNAGNGASIFLDSMAQFTNATVQRFTASGNTGDGLNVNRMGSGVIDNFVISNSSFTGNADGIDITAQFALLTDEYNINNNTVTGNNNNGIRFDAQADAIISTVLTNNTVENNLDDGVLITTTTVSPGDAARVISSAAWTGNSFSFNGNGGADAGIDISGLHNLLIGVNDGNALTFSNQIIGNTGDGIEVNASSVMGGSLTVIDADISGNVTEGTADGRAGVDINSNGVNNVVIMGSRINANLGDGIEIDNLNTNGSTYTLTDNLITFNGRDGVEYIDTGDGTLTINGTNTTTSQITDNGQSGTAGRGVDLIIGGNSNTNSTININNTSVLRNAQEGINLILTSSNTQRNTDPRDALSTVALQNNGAIGTTPFATVNIGTAGGNIINNNGQATGNIGGAGLVMRIGTTLGGQGITAMGGFANGNNGGVVADVRNNQLIGNFGSDVFIQSFVSTVNPATTGGAWTDQNENPRNAANDAFTPTGFQSDPLARLDLIFNNNSGEELGVTNQGAAYTNAEAVFKSRTQGQDNNTDGGIDDDGPFAAGDRSRNAQRLAARNIDGLQSGVLAGTKLNPDLTIGQSDTFLFPGLGQSTFRVQQMGNVFNSTPPNGFFILDNFAADPTGNNAIYDSYIEAMGVIGTNIRQGGATANGGVNPFFIDTMPWGWSILP